MSESSSQSAKILISAGEVSGDKHARLIVDQLRAEFPNASIKAMGGSELRAANVETIVDAEVYGGKNGFNLIDILYSSLIAFWVMLKCLYRWRPDVLILVDYPDFNLRLAFFAKLLGVPVLYHIPPKLWAWRKGRIKRIKNSVDKVACIFPFEPQFYADHNYSKASFVGHPFSEEFKADFDRMQKKQTFCATHGLDSTEQLFTIFPGSRSSEVTRHLPILLETISKVRQEIPKAQFVIVKAPGLQDELFSSIGTLDGVRVLRDVQIDSLQAADVGLLKSGTCNLEAAFCKLPFVCMYTTPKISAWIIRRFVKLKEYSLVNIIRSNTVKEIMQEDATPTKLSAALIELALNQNGERDRVTKGLAATVEALQHSGEDDTQTSAARNAASLAAELIEHRPPKRVLSRLFAYLKPYKRHFYLSLLCMVLFGASDGVIPFLVKHILDGVFSEQNEQLLYSLPLLLVAFALLRATVDVGQHFLLSRIGHSIVRDIRNDTAAHLLRMSPGYFHRQSSGNLLSRFTSDVVLVRELLTNSISSLIRDIIRIIALLATAFYLDPLLGLIAFVVFPIGIIPVYRFGKRMRKLSKRGQEAIGSLSALLHQSIIGNKVVKIFGREEYEYQRFYEENERLNKTFIKSELIRAVTGPVNELLSIGAISAVILYGGMSVIEGTRTQGDFIAFLLALFLLYDPFKKLSKLNNQVQQGISGAERIFELLDTPPVIVSPSTPISMPNKFDIQISHLDFMYPNTEQAALKGINLTVPENTKLALVGFSGSGKSTLVDLIPRFIDPQAGTVSIGGVDVRDISISSLRSQIAMVDQHTFLFQDSIFNNIAYGKSDATLEEVQEAAKAANAYEFISQLPEGFDTVVGESGLTLSGGERQRIAIARAILKDAPILILDEATASLDNKSEQLVQSALEALEQDRTTVVIAHRLSTVRNADRIIVLEHGTIVETGTHDELLEKGGAFAKLYALQFGGQTSSMERVGYAN